MDKNKANIIFEKDDTSNCEEKRNLNLLIYQTLMGITMMTSDIKKRVEGIEEKVEENSPKNFGLPLNQKFSLSVEEAAVYFGIGERRLRQIAAEHSGEDFILEIGTHVRFKRVLFEQFLSKTTSV